MRGRRDAVSRLEETAEMAGIGEPPPDTDLGDGLRRAERITEILTTPLQPQPPYRATGALVRHFEELLQIAQ
jgi:hypothetical protein